MGCAASNDQQDAEAQRIAEEEAARAAMKVSVTVRAVALNEEVAALG